MFLEKIADTLSRPFRILSRFEKELPLIARAYRSDYASGI